VDTVKHSDPNGPSLLLVSKALLKLPKSMHLLTDSLIKLMLLKDILTLFLSQQDLKINQFITLMKVQEQSILFNNGLSKKSELTKDF